MYKLKKKLFSSSSLLPIRDPTGGHPMVAGHGCIQPSNKANVMYLHSLPGQDNKSFSDSLGRECWYSCTIIECALTGA